MEIPNLSTPTLDEIFNDDLKLSPNGWDMIKDKFRSLENNKLRELVKLKNRTIRYLAKSVLYERGAIKI